MTRILSIDGIINVRDFGGFATTSGARMKRNLLFRSGHHADVSDQGVVHLDALELDVIIDLRTAGERQRKPSRRGSRPALVIENDIPNELGDWEQLLPGKVPDRALFEADILSFYRSAPYSPRIVDLYTRGMAALAAADGAALVHCHAGKDRTGIFVALVQILMGVHRDDVIEDYLETNRHFTVDPRARAETAGFIAQMTGHQIAEDVLDYLNGVDAAWLDAAFSAMTEKCGSVDAYAEQQLGVDAGTRARLEQRLLEG